MSRNDCHTVSTVQNIINAGVVGIHINSYLGKQSTINLDGEVKELQL